MFQWTSPATGAVAAAPPPAGQPTLSVAPKKLLPPAPGPTFKPVLARPVPTTK